MRYRPHGTLKAAMNEMRKVPTLDMQDRDTEGRELGSLAVSEIADSLRKRHGLAKQGKPAKEVRELRAKKCRTCGVKFTPTKPLQSRCSVECAIEAAKVSRTRKDRAELRQAKERLKSRGDWAKEAQIAFNAYIRARDKAKGFGCISCGTRQGKENAGHYRSVGSCPELRFEELNNHLQCERCNTHLSGNLINYRIALVQRIGLDKVEWLESKHEAKHYSIDDLKTLKATYKAKIKLITT